MRSSASRFFSNSQIAKLFRSVAAALELSPGDNRFRIAAYNRAADSVEHATSDVKDLWDDGRLNDLPGIGDNLQQHLDELFRTGRVRHFQTLLKPFPPAIFELLDIPGIGPKTAFSLCKALGIYTAYTAVKDLEKAAKKGYIAAVTGFGPDSQTQILQGIDELKHRSRRLLLPVADRTANEVIAWLKKSTAVIQALPLGSLRRRTATVGDIDIAVSTLNPAAVIAHFAAYHRISRILDAGDKSASAVLVDGLRIDLKTGSPDEFGSLLQHFTGSKLHNIALREYAQKQKYSLSEHGIKTRSGLRKFKTEAGFYAFLGLDLIPPELREGTGEIDLAKNRKLPSLIEIADIRGDLHVHSDLDLQTSHDLGADALSTLARKAKALGYEYLGLTEHNPSQSRHSTAEIINLIKMKTKVVHQFNLACENSHEKEPYLLNGLEIDLTPDGDRALPDECLDLLDYACIGIHSSFRQNRQTATNRIIRGLDHPKVKFLVHPTGRLLGEREGISLDWNRIFAFCLAHDKWLEINSYPNRLDLPDTLVSQAITHGVKLVINTDSHAAAHLDHMPYGVWVARRGGVEAKTVINSLPFAKLVKLIGKEVN